jgi:hypothetical protein
MTHLFRFFTTKYKVISLFLSVAVFVSFFIVLSYTHEDALSNIAHARNSVSCIQMTGLPCNKAIAFLACMHVLLVATLLYPHANQHIQEVRFSLSVPDPYRQAMLATLDPLKSFLRKGIIHNLVYA